MVTLPQGKRKEELNHSDNKLIPIKSIRGISIKKFRTIHDQYVKLGSNMTVLSGRNGTMKTSIMGLIAHIFDSEAEDAFGKPLKTTLSEVFKLSPKFDSSKYEYDIILETSSGELLQEPVTIYYVAEATKRHRVVVSGSEKGDGNFVYNTSFLNLKRLYPLVDTNAKEQQEKIVSLTASEARDLKDFYETVFPSSDYNEFVPIIATSNAKTTKTTFGPSGEKARYDWSSISSGEDNLGAIFNRLLGFQRSLAKNGLNGNGILCIDEFESSLHPVAQLRLFDYLHRWSRKNKVQVILTTHSLHLISHIYLKHKDKQANNHIVVNFISSATADQNNYPILHNPDYDLAYKELTFEQPAAAAEARRIKVLCEDDMAIHLIKKLIKRTDVIRSIEFHSSLNQEATNPGTSYTALTSLCIQFPLLLERSLVIFDADVSSNQLAKIKNKNLFLILPDKDNIAIERRIIVYILSMNNSDKFFLNFNKERAAFQDEFKQAGIKSLTISDILDEKIIPIEKCKAWATNNKTNFKRYITYYCNNLSERLEFQNNLIDAINRINLASGIPGLLQSKS